MNFEQEGPDAMGFIPYIDGYFFSQPANNVYQVDIYIDRSVLVMYINDNVCYTNRIYGLSGKPWTIRCYNGSVQIANIRQQYHDPDITSSMDEAVNQSQRQEYKRLENNHIVIYRGQDKYTIMGQKL